MMYIAFKDKRCPKRAAEKLDYEKTCLVSYAIHII